MATSVFFRLYHMYFLFIKEHIIIFFYLQLVNWFITSLITLLLTYLLITWFNIVGTSYFLLSLT